PLRRLRPDQLREPPQAVLAGGALDHPQRTRNRAGRVGDGNTRPRRPIIDRNDFHVSARRRASSAFATASPSFSGLLPPPRATVGRPPPPPPTSAAASRITA